LFENSNFLDQEAAELEKKTKAQQIEKEKLKVEQARLDKERDVRLKAEEARQRLVEQAALERAEKERVEKEKEAEEMRKAAIEKEKEMSMRAARRSSMLREWFRLGDKLIMTDRQKCLLAGQRSIQRCCEGAYKVKLMLYWSKWRKLREMTKMRKLEMDNTINSIDISQSLEPIMQQLTMSETAKETEGSRRRSMQASKATASRTWSSLLRQPHEALRGEQFSQHFHDDSNTGYDMGNDAARSSEGNHHHHHHIEGSSKRRDRDVFRDDNDDDDDVNVSRRSSELIVEAFHSLAAMKAPPSSKRMRVSSSLSNNHSGRLKRSLMSSNTGNEFTPATPNKSSSSSSLNTSGQPNITPFSQISTTGGRSSFYSTNSHQFTPNPSHSVETLAGSVSKVTLAAEIALEGSKKWFAQAPVLKQPRKVSYLDALKGTPAVRVATTLMTQDQRNTLSKAVSENNNFEKSLSAMAVLPPPPPPPKQRSLVAGGPRQQPPSSPMVRATSSAHQREARRQEDILFESKLKAMY
jgi:hypothetical protein